MDADEVEIRVLGCLIEKQRTTPDVYPLSLNSLRLACNQSTNRDPVVDYDEHTIHEALHRLHHRGWARLTSGAGSRTVKYRHLLDNALSLEPEQLALLAVLLLRGPQTPGELKQRSERLYPLETLADVEAVLASLVERELVARLERRPGQKEERYVQLLGASAEQEVHVHEGPRDLYPASAAASLGERVAALESEVATLRHVLEELAGPIEPS